MEGESDPLLEKPWSVQRSQGHGTFHSSSQRSSATDIYFHSEDEDDSLREISRLPEVSLLATMKRYVKECCNVHDAKKKFPIIKWLPKYSFLDAQGDIISGLTVAMTVLPQGLAYAVVAGLPLQYGLYSAFMGCFVYTILGTSKDITLGPTAIMSLMTATFATSPRENDPTYALSLTLICGVVQALMGLLHLGIMVNFISYPVINAFTSAAAITIAFGQVKGVLGLRDIPKDFLEQVYETCRKIPETRVWDLTMGLSSIVILILMMQLRKIKWHQPGPNERIPMPVLMFRKFVWLSSIGANAILVVITAGIAAILDVHGHGDAVSTIGEVQAGLPPFKPPSFSSDYYDTQTNTTVHLDAGDIFSHIGTGIIVVPILGLVEAIAIGRAFARQNNYRIEPNQELIAIGIANIMSSFVSSYPVTGSFSRTAVNSQSGVRTPMGGMVTGGIIILSLLFLTPLFKYIPQPALAAIIIVAVVQMIDYEIILNFWKIEKLAFVPWGVTFLVSFGLGLEYGILVGIGVHLMILLYPVARPKITAKYLDYVVITFNQSIRYPSVEYLQNKVQQYMYKNQDAGGPPMSVILDCQHLTTSLDYTTMMGLIEIIADFKRKDVHFSMAGCKKSIIKELKHADIKDIIFGDTIEDAIKKIHEAEQHGSFEDQLESITIIKGRLAGATAVNATPVPSRRLPRLSPNGGLETSPEMPAPAPATRIARLSPVRVPETNLAISEESDSDDEGKFGSPDQDKTLRM
ncbi:sodium-independent sulfate anion transporter-like [Dreissena polymorpha]|uniref:sodium-independent sulfate anion transporter-like n=1 Tax=Dreissena polymorpha TaxID=45954 RepID=UPI0022646055|nr:sodium-independent sulfate anion transporter-like [Dreissena polymorpha]XP_052263655.1 sodium-independent sulfate anion transporter-like [Dreissena polymorpha]